MEENKNLEQEQTENKDEVIQEENNQQDNTENNSNETKEEAKDNVEESVETEKVAQLEEKLKALEEENRKKDEALKSQTIKNTILEKIPDKELQKAVLETGLVKDVDDIEKVLRIVELSKSNNTKKFSDGYIPLDQVKADAYQQAEKKGDIFSMIKQKMNKQ